MHTNRDHYQHQHKECIQDAQNCSNNDLSVFFKFEAEAHVDGWRSYNYAQSHSKMEVEEEGQTFWRTIDETVNFFKTNFGLVLYCMACL